MNELMAGFGRKTASDKLDISRWIDVGIRRLSATRPESPNSATLHCATWQHIFMCLSTCLASYSGRVSEGFRTG
jgi:hypothetical protein